MKTIKTTKRTNLAPVLSHGMRFRNSTGSLHGSPDAGAAYGSPGWLSGADYEQWMSNREMVEYVVFSYGTPIAWRCWDGWYIVGQRFSVTTSHHQGQVRRGIAAIG